MRRRFELVGGASSKFWEVVQSGSTMTVRFGRIATAGQEKSKRLASPDAARREVDRLIGEKVGKGYLEVTEKPPPAAAPPEHGRRTNAPDVSAAYGLAFDALVEKPALARIREKVLGGLSLSEDDARAMLHGKVRRTKSKPRKDRAAHPETPEWFWTRFDALEGRNHERGLWGFALAVMALSMGRVEAARACGPLHVPAMQIQLFAGDLSVAGDLTVDGELIVLGNLDVSGVFRDAVGGHTAVARNFTARGVWSEATLLVARKLTAEFAFLGYNMGSAMVFDGCSVRVLLERDHGGSKVFGHVDVDVLDRDELELELPLPAASAADQARTLKRLLRPDLAERATRCVVPDADERRDIHGLAELLFRTLRDGGELFPKRS